MTDQIKNNKDIKEGEERMKEHDEKAKTWKILSFHF